MRRLWRVLLPVAVVGLLHGCASRVGPTDGGAWRGLIIAPESRCTPYDPDDYTYPQSVEADIVGALGGLDSPYTCETFLSVLEADIEHIVARSEAHDSGLCSATADTRRRFSRDLLNLTLASPSLNRHDKGGKDAAEWVPVQNQCWFAQRGWTCGAPTG